MNSSMHARVGTSRAILMRRLGRWVATMGMLIVAACTRPYGNPQIESTYIPAGMNATITGLVDQAAPGPLKVIWTHGVCATDVNWVVDRILLVQAALGPGTTVNGSADPPNAGMLQPVKGIVPKGLTAEAVFVYKSLFETPARRQLAVYFVVWSKVDDPNRQELAYDVNDPTHARAGLNNDIKLFFDTCLVDAVAYSGDNGPIIRDGVAQAMRYAFDQPDSPTGPARLAYVSESMGSKILFDIVNESADSDFVRRAAQFDYFFMMANQIPILDQAGVPTRDLAQAPLPDGHLARKPSVRRFLETITQYRDKARPKPTIVAFFDPNDLLSYELTTKIVGEDARLINVAVSNDDTWFWYLENPANAHCGYGMNQSVINLVTTGDPNKGPPVPPNILALACSGSQ